MNKMKFSPIGKLLFACAMVVFLGGCTDKVTETVYVDFSLSRYSVAFPVEGGTTSITVATEDSWDAATNAEWLVLGVDGDKLTISAMKNDETDVIRDAEVTITTKSHGVAAVQVRQEPADTPAITLTYNADNRAIDSEGGKYVVSVSSNYDWTASLTESVPGWELTTDKAAGILTVAAEANAGDTVKGTVVVTAGGDKFSASESIVLTQASRADNAYFQFTGDWDIYASDCFSENEWKGESGIYTSCTFVEYDYFAELMSFINFAEADDLRSDAVEYSAEDRSLTLPIGGLCGQMTVDGNVFSMYLAVFNETVSKFLSNTGSPVVFTLSDDGASASVSGFSDDYPIIGYVGYNANYGYCSFSMYMPYCKAPLSLTKTETKATALRAGASRISFRPIAELSEGVPSRLPDGFAGEVSEYVIL